MLSVAYPSRSNAILAIGQGKPAMKAVRFKRSLETPSYLIAAAVAIGALYLTGLVLIHQLVG